MNPTGALRPFKPLPEPKTTIFEPKSRFWGLPVGNRFEVDNLLLLTCLFFVCVWFALTCVVLLCLFLLRFAFFLCVALFCFVWCSRYFVELPLLVALRFFVCGLSCNASLLCLLLVRVLASDSVLVWTARWAQAWSWTGPMDPGLGPPLR